MKKSIKQKQRQKQSVTINVNVAKSKAKSRGKTRAKKSSSKQPSSVTNLPPPIHQVYTSPIHNLVPQAFSKEGKQIPQQTLMDQIKDIITKKEEPKNVNVLGETPQSSRKIPNIQS